MLSTIDAGGRIVIPKSLRRRLGLEAGSEVEIIERDGAVELRPVALPVRLVDGPHGPVAVSDRPVPVLTADTVRAATEHLRR